MIATTSSRKNVSPADRRYRVYVAYQRANNQDEGRRWATWLQESLENYRVPNKFVGSSNSKGERIPKTLFPVYRARRKKDEAKSRQDLDALRNSSALVVVASPESAVCKQTCEEVRFFKELGKGDRIVVLMIRGEPHADVASKAEFGIRLEDECLADELRYGKPRRDGTVNWGAPVEPLSADVRVPAEDDHLSMTTGEGFTHEVPWYAELLRRGIPAAKAQSQADAYAARLEKAKTTLVAGVLGIPAQDLIRESGSFRERRLKQGLVALGAISAALAITAILGFAGKDSAESGGERQPGGEVAAQTQALEAAKQRVEQLQGEVVQSEADARENLRKIRESQAQFEQMSVALLSDFGDAAKTQDALKNLAAAVEVARAHFAGIPAGSSRPADRALLASVLETQAAILEKSSNLEGSLAKLEESLALVEQNQDAFSGEVSWLAAQSRLRHRIGEIRLVQEKFDGAQQAFNSALELDKQLAGLQPGEVKWRQNLSSGKQQITTILELRGDRDTVVGALDRSILAAGELDSGIQEDLSSQDETATELAEKGRAMVDRGDLEGAAECFREVVDLRRTQAGENPDVPAAYEAVSQAHSELAAVLQDLGKSDAARQNYSQAVEAVQTVVRLQPREIEGFVRLAAAYEDLAKTQVDEQTSLALSNTQAANGLWVQITAADPGNLDHLRSLAQSHQDLGVLKWKTQDLQGAAVAFQALAELAGKLGQREPENTQWIQLSASTQRYLVQLYHQLGDAPNAEQAASLALTQTERLLAAEPENTEWLVQLRADYEAAANANLARKKFPEAKAMLVQVSGLMSRLAVLKPETAASPLETQLFLEKLADISLKMGDLSAAREEYEQALAVARQIAETEPENIDAQARLALLTETAGDVLASLNDLAGAEQQYAQCLEIAAATAKRDPAEDAWWKMAGACHIKLGAMHETREDLPKAKASYEAAVQAYDYLVQRSPENPAWQNDLCESYEKLGEVAMKLGQMDLALNHYQRGFNLRQQLVSLDPANALWQSEIARLAFQIGKIHSANRNRREAINWLNRSKEQLDAMANQNTLREDDRWVVDAVSEELRSLGRFRVLGGAP